jgi:hypothetical protein
MSKQIAAMRERDVRICSVYLDEGYIVFYNGVVLPICGFYDEDDNAVEDLEEASYYEAGDEEHGYVTCPMPEQDHIICRAEYH